jgi:hypothetical protein
MRPPRPSRSRRPVACRTAPAPRMIEDVEECGRHRHRRRGVLGVGAEGQCQAQRHEDHADILDRRIGQYALEVAVEHGVEQAQHRRHCTQNDGRERPSPGGRAEQVEGDAHEAVDRHLGHDAAHQRRDVARRRRMGERQPGVQGDQSALRAATDERCRQHQCGDQRLGWMGANGVESIAAGRPGETAEGEQQRHRADRRHDEVEMSSPSAFRVGVAGNDQRPRGERHQLPRKQEGVGVVGDQDQVHRRGEQRKQWLDPRRQLLRPVEAHAVDAGRDDAAIDDDAEEGRQRVQPQVKANRRQADRQPYRRLAAAQQHVQIDDAEHDRGQCAQRIDEGQSRPAHQCRHGGARRQCP